MMPPHASFHATNDLTRQLKKSLYDYNYEAGDSLISMGDPCIIAVACAILGRDFGKFAILKWDRQLGRYIKSHIKI